MGVFQWLVDFFSNLVQMWGSVWHFIITAIKGLISIFMNLPNLISIVTNMLQGLPTVLVTFITLTITISVVFLLVGRGEGGD